VATTKCPPAADGSIAIQDSNPLFARSSLKDYLAGFSSGGSTWTGELKAVVQMALQPPAATRFLLGALSQASDLIQQMALDVQSPAGVCGLAWEADDTVDAAGNSPAGGPLVSRIVACDGQSAAYQMRVGTGQPYHAFVTDLATAGSTVDLSGSAPSTYKATRSGANLVVAPQDISFTADAVVNAATFTSGVAPGGIVAIFGSGLSGPGAATGVDLDGAQATVLFASPFQIDAVLPDGVAPGTHSLRVRSAFGTAQQNIDVSAVAPAIFLIGNPPAGAVENQDGSLNGAFNPASRGQTLVVYATGLGPLVTQGQLSVVTNAVSVELNGQELQPNYAGSAPGFPGLYQINVPIPAAMPPGLGLLLTLKEAGQVSNAVPVALQ
jgi:uncharacterized protein (TIGR03437 family)